MTYVKQRFVISTASFTAFQPNVNCNAIVFRNISSVAVKLRTISGDATTEDTLNPNDQEILPSTVRTVMAGSNNQPLFASGATVCFFQATGTATQTLMATLFSE